ncbi:thiamine-phosphate kinase [Lacibacterium aquatile]|uniref:Thiamine-monophosphate kinase n=1 Tax=Lacibacterium aquatile TaxID=1168082 RepID=A0ABW5DPX5_9PROT
MSADGEFERIAAIFAPLAADFPGALGLTDDAALLQCPPGFELVVTTDALVAGVHFLWPGEPELIAAKALRKNLSDLAAMGAAPLAYSLATLLTAECDLAWLRRFAAGLAETQRLSGIGLSGGDSVKTPGPPTFSITAFGLVPQGSALRRNGARPDDIVYVSGTLGDAAVGLRLARDGGGEGLPDHDRAALIERHWVPPLRLALGQALRGVASSAMDVSDGLIGDLGHIAASSGVDILIEAARLPLSDAFNSAMKLNHSRLEDALTGGDDYELVFTASSNQGMRISQIAADIGIRLTEVGRVAAPGGTPGVQVLDASGQVVPLTRTGWRHF